MRYIISLNVSLIHCRHRNLITLLVIRHRKACNSGEHNSRYKIHTNCGRGRPQVALLIASKRACKRSRYNIKIHANSNCVRGRPQAAGRRPQAALIASKWSCRCGSTTLAQGVPVHNTRQGVFLSQVNNTVDHAHHVTRDGITHLVTPC